MDVGPEHARHLGLRAEVDCTEASKNATPRSADIREGVGYSGMQRGVAAFENGIVPVEYPSSAAGPAWFGVPLLGGCNALLTSPLHARQPLDHIVEHPADAQPQGPAAPPNLERPTARRLKGS